MYGSAYDESSLPCVNPAGHQQQSRDIFVVENAAASKTARSSSRGRTISLMRMGHSDSCEMLQRAGGCFQNDAWENLNSDNPVFPQGTYYQLPVDALILFHSLMKDFPQELLDHVIDDVASSKNTMDLSACGCVCRRWLHRRRVHLFSHITLSDTSSAAVERFLTLVDGSSVPLLSFVQSLDMHFARRPFRDGDMARLQNCTALTNLCIYARANLRYPFDRWLQTHIPRFGAACPYLSHLELMGLGSDVLLCTIVDVILALPALTHLRICGGAYKSEPEYGVLGGGAILATDAFPRHLHTLDIALYRGMDFFFQWLLAQEQLPVFTSLKLGGRANGAPIEPLNTYFQLVGSKIESLSLDYWVDGVDATDAFEERAMTLTTNLVHLSRARQYPLYLHTTFTSLSSVRLATISIEVWPMPAFGRADWLAIDEVLAAPQFSALRRITFTDQRTKTSMVTALVREWMPQVTARGILD
ncbi:hypothetical protein C8J57DRAFT_1476099 [Mycena rebaudengoi]|nr:hypothetical protein C8J57DRAFT_1476099 [Mycena rebaudengoi]